MDQLGYLDINSHNWELHEAQLKQLCLSSESDSSDAAKNLHWTDWKQNPSSLMSALVNEKRFDFPNGLFTVLTKNGFPIACSGCYLSDWSSQVVVIGVRTWTSPNFRDDWWHGKYLIPRQIQFAKNLKAASAVMTINQNNTKLQKFIKRIIDGKTVVFGENNPNVYKDFIYLEQDFLIKNCLQKIAYLPLNCNSIDFQNYHLPPKGI